MRVKCIKTRVTGELIEFKGYLSLTFHVPLSGIRQNLSTLREIHQICSLLYRLVDLLHFIFCTERVTLCLCKD